MNVATRPTKSERKTDPANKSLARSRLAIAMTQSANACITIQKAVTDEGGLVAMQALFPDGTDAADLVVGFNACRTLATTLDPALVIADLA